MPRVLLPTLAVAALAHGSLAVAPSCAQPGGGPAAHPTHRFVPDTNRWVQIVRGEELLIGKLDAAGNLVETERRRANEPILSGTRWFHVLNATAKPKVVYEFRSDVLVPGTMQPDGNFVPQVGGKILSFSDYGYSGTSTPIWNLPGYFEPVRKNTR